MSDGREGGATGEGSDAPLKFYDGFFFHEYSIKQPGDRVQTWTMTTPNASWLPNPPEPHRTVRLRTNGFFGLDDPCLWPQLLYPGHEHLACIRMNDPDSNSGISFCRNGISVERNGNRTEDGSHKLNPASYARCSTHMVILIGRTKTLAVSDRSTLDKLINLLRNALQQLKIFSGIAKHLKYRFAVFSRLYLELEAYINYHTITLSPTSESPTPKGSFIGAFTFSPDQANILYQQGIPVWYIRPKKVAAEESPQLLQRSHPNGPRSKDLLFDGGAITLDADSPLEPFFTGPVSDPTYLAIIREWNLRYTFGVTSQAWITQYDPSTSSITKPHYPSTHSNSSTIGKRRGRDDVGSAGVVSSNKKQRKRPGYETTRKDNRSVGGATRPQETIPKEIANAHSNPSAIPIRPIPIGAWQGALSASTESIPVPSRHFYPHPDIFLNMQTRQGLQRAVAAWLHIKPFWMNRVSENGAVPAFVSNRAWKLYLHSFFADPQKVTGGAPSKQLHDFTDFMGTPKRPGFRTELYEFSFKWKRVSGPLYEVVTDEIIAHTIWELYELNFRHDLLEIEGLRTGDPAELLEQRLAVCVGSVGDYLSNSYTAVPKRHSDLERASSIVSLRNTMRSWDGAKPPGFEQPYEVANHDPDEFALLEASVCRYYCDSVRRFLNRPPIVPVLPPS